MTQDYDLTAICSLTSMARKLGLSRARFYQLQGTGVFPPPVYCLYTRRPFYPRDLQQRCLEIRKTGIGFDGRPVLFNGPRKRKTRCPQKSSDRLYRELVTTLGRMGLNVSSRQIATAVDALHPGGLTADRIDGEVLTRLLQHLKGRR